MLKVPQLDDITYDQMVQRAINKIPAMTKQWTDFNYHDPGVTVLQTYAWLVDMLNYYMNATGDVHVLKYLKLLGMEPQPAQRASTYLASAGSGHVHLPAGSRVFSGSICYELCNTYDFGQNKLVSYLNEVDESAIDLTAFVGADHDAAGMFAADFEQQAAVYFGFEHPLGQESPVLFLLQENPQRNAFDESFQLSQLTWQYYGKDGWQDVDAVQDKTCGFLRSEVITFTIKGEMAGYQHPQADILSAGKCYYLRCILRENRYDVMPKLVSVFTNPMHVVQQDTVCGTETMIYQGEEQLAVSGQIHPEDYLIVGIGAGEHFEVAFEYQENPEDKCHIYVNEHGEAYISFEGCEAPAGGTQIQLIRMREELLPQLRLERTNGCCNQAVFFHYDDIERIAEIGLSLWKEQDDGTYTYEQWHYVSELAQCDYMDNVFTYDAENEQIVFGDGIHGAVPEQNLIICVTHLVVSRYEDGNVMPGELSALEEQTDEDYALFNPLGTDNGRYPDTVEDMLKRLSEVLFTQNRMVSPQDYRSLTMRTPGLMIEDVQVIAGKRYAEIHNKTQEDQAVYLVVKPIADEERPQLSSSYEQMILDYLEPYRLMNTQVRLVSPRYVGVEIHGKILLGSTSEKEQILQFLSEQAAGDGSKTEFGKQIILGKIFTRLEIFESVKKVEYLSLERTGNGAVKNSRGDLILYEDAIPYVRSIQIEFC